MCHFLKKSCILLHDVRTIKTDSRKKEKPQRFSRQGFIGGETKESDLFSSPNNHTEVVSMKASKHYTPRQCMRKVLIIKTFVYQSMVALPQFNLRGNASCVNYPIKHLPLHN